MILAKVPFGRSKTDLSPARPRKRSVSPPVKSRLHHTSNHRRKVAGNGLLSLGHHAHDFFVGTAEGLDLGKGLRGDSESRGPRQSTD